MDDKRRNITVGNLLLV